MTYFSVGLWGLLVNGHWSNRDFNRFDKPLEVTLVAKVFATPQGQLLALHQINLFVNPGEFITICGPSGAGKSTLLRLIAGLDTPDMGHLSLNGQPISGPGPERGLIFHQPTVYPWLTVGENVGFGLKLQYFAKSERNKQVEIYLNLVGLVDCEQLYPKDLSEEQLQRMAIARALICEPKLLLLDDPFVTLDIPSRERLQELLLKIWQYFGVSILLATRDITEAIFLGQRVYLLSNHIQAEVPIDLPQPRTQRLKQEPQLLNYIKYMADLSH